MYFNRKVGCMLGHVFREGRIVTLFHGLQSRLINRLHTTGLGDFGPKQLSGRGQPESDD